MSDNIPKISVQIGADSSKLAADLAKAHSMFDSTAKQVSSLFSGAGSALSAGLGLLAGGAILKDTISTTIKVTDEIRKLSGQLGISAEQASVLRVGLDDVFISTDTFSSAASKLTKTLKTDEQAFIDLGVATRDSNGNFRDTTAIMADTNSKLSEFSAGTDRNIEGMKIYGKGWDEARKTLKWTTEAMQEAEERTKSLNLVIGDEGLRAARSYKGAMKDIEDVSESVKVQIGMALIPELTKLAVVFGDVGGSFSTVFVAPIARGLRTVVEMVEVTTVTTAAFFDKMIRRMQVIKWNKSTQKYDLYDSSKDVANIDAARDAQLAEIYKKFNQIENYKSKAVADKRSTGGKPEAVTGGRDNSDLLEVQAHEKYLEYLKAFAAREIETIKAANAMKQEIAKFNYETGLIDQQQFLAVKLAAIEDEGKKELEIRVAEVQKYRAEVEKYKNADDEKAAVNYHAALVKVTTAEKELIQTQSKLAVARQTNLLEMEKAELDRNSRLHTLNVQLQEVAGRYEDAAKARWKFEQSTPEYMRASDEERDARRKQADTNIGAAGRRQRQNEAYGVASSRMSAYGGGGMVGQMFGYQSVYNQRMEELREFKELELLTEEQYQGKSLQAEQLFQDQKTGIMLDAAAQSIGIMRQAFGDSKEAQLAALVMEKAIAVARIMVSTEVAAAGVKAAYAAVPGGLAIAAAQEAAIRAMSYVSIGLVLASGIVEGIQIAGKRALGGPVRAGQTYIVNENRATQGPEYFTPGVDGVITPADKVGAGGFVQNVTIDARGSDSGVLARIDNAMRKAKQEAKQEIMDSMNRAGAFSRAVRRA